MPPLNYLVSETESGLRIDQFLAQQSGQSRAVIQEHLKELLVHLNHQPVIKPATRLKTGDIVVLLLKENEETSLNPVQGNLDILFEDEHLLLINKAQGVVVHPAAGHRGDTLVHHLLFYLGSSQDFTESSSFRPGIVHRLDRGTSGVLLIAKNRKIQDSLSLQFKNREVKKEYEAIVWGAIKSSGTLRNAIGRDRIHRKKMSSKSSFKRPAETSYTPLQAFRHFTHLLVRPHTGRTHQIRVHLSEFSHSIVGDPLYGKGTTQKRLHLLSPELQRQLESVTMTFLHASSLEFTHPVTGHRHVIKAPRPASFELFLELLKKENTL